jgi:hypothetical protein
MSGAIADTADPSATLRSGRDDKGKGNGFTEGGCWTGAFFISLGGPQAHDSYAPNVTGRADDGFSAAPTALGPSGSISQPFRAGLTFGGRPSGPCIHGDLSGVISPSTCRRQLSCDSLRRVGREMTKLVPSAKSKGETEGCPRSRF